jgi:hypothetical protein
MKRFIVECLEDGANVFVISDQYLQNCVFEAKLVAAHRSIMKYIKRAPHYSIVMDTTPCIFSGERISHNHTFQTDGKWIWSADLVHYTEKHNFQWPQAFLDHLQQAGYKRGLTFKDLMNRKAPSRIDVFHMGRNDYDGNPFEFRKSLREKNWFNYIEL